MNESQITDVLGGYRRAAIAHGDASAAGNVVAVDRAAAVLDEARSMFVDGTDDDRQRFLELQHDPSEFVRCWAAMHALDLEPTKAEATLEAIASAKGGAWYTASTALEDWRAGRLRFAYRGDEPVPPPR